MKLKKSIEQYLDEALMRIAQSGDCIGLIEFIVEDYVKEMTELNIKPSSEEFNKIMGERMSSNNKLMAEIIHKLLKDGYIRENPSTWTIKYINGDKYLVTAEGRLFEGYVKSKGSPS